MFLWITLYLSSFRFLLKFWKMATVNNLTSPVLALDRPLFYAISFGDLCIEGGYPPPKHLPLDTTLLTTVVLRKMSALVSASYLVLRLLTEEMALKYKSKSEFIE